VKSLGFNDPWFMNAVNCCFACAIASGVHWPGLWMPQRSRHFCVPWATFNGILAAMDLICCTPISARVAFMLQWMD
jgi:hypothetical protein